MKKRIRCAIVALVMVFCMGFCGISVSAQQTGQTTKAVLSYGVSVLAAKTDVAVSAPVGNDVFFSSDVFARGLNLSRVEYIEVHTLPDEEDGALWLGATRVVAGQTISGGNLSLLTFVPETEAPTEATFTFSANGGAVPMVCNVYLTDAINYTPTVSMASGLFLNLSTYKDVAVHGKLSGFDPDGDAFVFEVVTYPQNGAVLLSDREQGTYVYTPNAGYLGSDRFCYVVRDQYGNYSASATVNLKITQQGSSVTFVDMKEHPSYSAAIAVTEKEIMSGTQVGNQYYFHPDRTVSRAEFLVMALNAIGIREVPVCDKTVFADDSDIPDTMKGYVAAAYELHYINGTLQNGKLCFLPNEEITRAEAAVIVSNLIGLCDVPVTPTFADGSEIPVWARESVYSLNAAGILIDRDGHISPGSCMTRADTAEILSAVVRYVE